MLPPALKNLKESLEAKGFAKRSGWEDTLLEDIKQVDTSLEKAKKSDRELTEGLEKRGTPNVVGPRPGECPVCGRGW